MHSTNILSLTMVTCLAGYGLLFLLLLLIMVMVMYANRDMNVCLWLYLFTAMRIFMYEIHQLCDDYYTLMARVFKKIISVIDQKKN